MTISCHECPLGSLTVFLILMSLSVACFWARLIICNHWEELVDIADFCCKVGDDDESYPRVPLLFSFWPEIMHAVDSICLLNRCLSFPFVDCRGNISIVHCGFGGRWWFLSKFPHWEIELFVEAESHCVEPVWPIVELPESVEFWSRICRILSVSLLESIVILNSSICALSMWK